MRHTIARIIEAPQSPSARRWRDPPRTASDLGVKVGDGGARNGSARLFGFGTMRPFWGLGCAVALDDETVGTMAESYTSGAVPGPRAVLPRKALAAQQRYPSRGCRPAVFFRAELFSFVTMTNQEELTVLLLEKVGRGKNLVNKGKN